MGEECHVQVQDRRPSMLKRKALNREPKFGPHLAMSLGGVGLLQHTGLWASSGLETGWNPSRPAWGQRPAGILKMSLLLLHLPIGTFPIPGVSHGCDTEPPGFDL